MSTPSLAAETGAMPLAAASSMLAAVTAPMLSVDPAAITDDQDFSSAERPVATTLAALVEDQQTADTTDDEQRCLAVSVYYESKGEPLNGQLAVAETVLNRAASGRFPASVCGVVRQAGQFGFVRGGTLPTPDQASAEWRRAVAIARIAQAEMWREVAPDALYFHASRVRPGWSGAKKIAQLGNHVFYR